MKTRKKLLPVLGITALATISAPIIASCSCGNEVCHCWYSPKANKRVVADHETNAGTFILILDSKDYKESDLDIKITGNNKGILSLDSFKINLNTVEVVVKCLDVSKTGDIPFGLDVKTKEWSEHIEFLALVASVAINSVQINGPAKITYNTTESYKAEVLDGSGALLEDEEVEWHIDSSGGGKVEASQTTGKGITLKGTVAGTVVLYATSKTVPTIQSNSITIEIVYSQPTDLILDPSSVNIRLDQTQKIKATVSPELTAHQKVNWTVTSGTEVISIKVSDDTTECTVVPKTKGTAVITASTPDEYGFSQITRTCGVTITDPLVKTVTINPDSPTIWNKDTAAGSLNSQQFNAKLEPASAASVKWSITSGNANINEDTGLVTQASGSTSKSIGVKATVQDEGKAYGTATLTIKYLLEGISIGKDTDTVKAKTDGSTLKTYTIESITPSYADWDASSTTWYGKNSTSSNIKISTDGKLTATEGGSIDIYATRTTHDGTVTVTSNTKTVTVEPPATSSVEIYTTPTKGVTSMWNTDSTTGTITYNSQSFAATVLPAAAVQDVKWSITDATDVKIGEKTGVLSVDANSKSDSVTVKALTNDGKSDTYDFDIKYVLQSFTVLGDETVQVNDGLTHKYEFTKSKGSTVTPENATYDATSIKWHVNDTTGTYATIGETTGILTPVSAGNVEVWATMTTHDGTITTESVHIPVQIKAPFATSVQVTPATKTIWNTDDSTGTSYNSVDYTAKVLPEGASQTVKWSANKSDVTIDENSGKLQLDENTASDTITVTATAQDKTTGAASGTGTLNVKYVLKSFSVKRTDTTGTLRAGKTAEFAIDEDSIMPSTAEYVASGSNIQWSSSDKNIADFTDSSKGTLTAKKEGNVTVTATVWTHVDDHAGEEGSWTVSSVELPVEVKAPYGDDVTINDMSDKTIWSDGSATYQATVTSTTGTTPSQAVSWKVYSDSTCKTESTIASMTTNPTTYLGTLTMNDPSTLDAPQTLYVQATATDTDPEKQPVVSSAAKVTVKIPLKEFSLKRTAVVARVGEDTKTTISVDTDSYKPTGCSVDSTAPVYSVTNVTGEATIDSSTGILTPTKKGTVKVTAVLKTHDGRDSITSDPLEIEIKPPYTKTLVISGESELWTDESSTTKKTMTATFTPDPGAEPTITWSSSKTSVATIDSSSGLLTLVGNGETIITATAKDDDGTTKTATHTLKVKVPADSVTITKSPASIQVAAVTPKADRTCEASVDPTTALDNGSIVWAVDDTTKATINSSTGEMTAVSAGTVNVTATWRATGRTDVVSTAVSVEITAPAVTGLSIIGPDVLSLNDGESHPTVQTYTAVATPTGASNEVKWSVNDTSKATINENTGELTCVSAGAVTITATSTATNAVTATKPITIVADSWTAIFKISNDGTTVEGFVDGLPTSTLSDYCVGGNLVFPNINQKYPNVTKVNASAFKSMFKSEQTYSGIVTKITIPANIVEIGDNAFEDNPEVTSVEIQGSTSIGNSAFVGCSNLSTVTGLNVTSVGKSAFEADNALTEVNFGTNASLQIGERAFADITKTAGSYVTLKANPVTIGKEAFYSSDVVWPGINSAAAITSIGEDAFNGCQLLEPGSTLTVNTKLAEATIGLTAFYGCGVESIVLPEQTTDNMYKNWGGQLFAGCTSLKEIDLSAWTTQVPSNLKDISDLFLDAGGTSASVWYYKDGISQSIISALSTWLSRQIGSETFSYWTATAKKSI